MPFDDANRTLDVFGKSQGEQNRIILIGGGNVGLRIAEALEVSENRVRVKIIETIDQEQSWLRVLWREQ